ncbi:hypothetical protein ABBQ38_005068 [Trebouxia sp. C0009 RCD-2024]
MSLIVYRCLKLPVPGSMQCTQHHADFTHTAGGLPAPLLWAPARLTQPLRLAPAANKRLRQMCTRARCGSSKKSFCIPETNGFLRLPLRETQKVDPKDVKDFWTKHASSLDVSPAFLGTEQGHSLLEEWDNGPFGMEEGFCTTPALPRHTGLSMTVLVMANNILEQAGFAAVDPHLRVSQHPGDKYFGRSCVLCHN